MKLSLEIVPLRGTARKTSSQPMPGAAFPKRETLHSTLGGFGQKGMGSRDASGTLGSWLYFFFIVVGILHPQAMLRGWAPTHRDVPDSSSV